MNKTFHAVFLMLVAMSGRAYAEGHIMPSELVEFARKNDCGQVSDFFSSSRVGMVNPPYVYGYLPGRSSDSAAFWCEKQSGKERRFFLIIMHRQLPQQIPADLRDVKHELARCPNKLETSAYPSGLEIYKNPQMTLDGFVYVSDPQKRPPRNTKLVHNAILSSYDGGEQLFYCYDGSWVVRIRH
jgi:hypothetical protein